MKLGVEVGLGPGHIVLDGDPSPSQRGTAPPIFGPYLLWPNSHPSQLLLSTCNMIPALGGHMDGQTDGKKRYIYQFCAVRNCKVLICITLYREKLTFKALSVTPC